MSDRQPTRSRFSATPRGVMRGVRMLSTGRWRPPLGQTPLTGRRAPRLIAVGAALPGLGKSVVASNLAVAMAGLGRHVALVDLDMAAPRQHALFGVDPAPEGGRLTGIRNLRLARAVDRRDAAAPGRAGADRCGRRDRGSRVGDARGSVELLRHGRAAHRDDRRRRRAAGDVRVPSPSGGPGRAATRGRRARGAGAVHGRPDRERGDRAGRRRSGSTPSRAWCASNSASR